MLDSCTCLYLSRLFIASCADQMLFLSASLHYLRFPWGFPPSSVNSWTVCAGCGGADDPLLNARAGKWWAGV